MLSATKNYATSKEYQAYGSWMPRSGTDRQTDGWTAATLNAPLQWGHNNNSGTLPVGTGNWKLQGFCCSKVLMSALADSDWEKATLFPSTVLFTPFLCILGDFQKKTAITPILAIIHYNSLKMPRKRVRVTQHQKWNGKNMKLIPRRSLEVWV